MKPVSHCLYQTGFGLENLLQQCHSLNMNMDDQLVVYWCVALRSFYFLFTALTVECCNHSQTFFCFAHEAFKLLTTSPK